MKEICSLAAAILITTSIWAQSPEMMNYQAVIRDANDDLVTSTSVAMQISVLQGSATGTEVYVETQSPTSNGNGIISIQIGSGTTSDDFSSIDWSNGPYFIKTETDLTGGTNYTITGTSQLLSVPYALHANTADSIVGGVSFTEVDGSTTNEIQQLSTNGDTIFISEGNYIVLPGLSNIGSLLTPLSVQGRLNSGETPLEIYNSNNVLLDSLYGKIYQGGLLFYLNTNDGTGLVSALTDQSSALQWYNGAFNNTGATGTAVGTGQANTDAIIAEQGAPMTNYAAGLARSYNGGGHTDWFLPSQDELNLMYQIIGQGDVIGIGNIGGFADAGYWSSTDVDFIDAIAQSFTSGLSGTNGKSAATYVRAIRAF